MTDKPISISMCATSYPRSTTDWQGIFIKKLADALGEDPDLSLSLWAPKGPISEKVRYACSEEDTGWLQRLTEEGGIAHLLRKNKIRGIMKGLSLTKRLKSYYAKEISQYDLIHVNWLQNGLALYGTDTPALITVLGTDYKLLNLPFMATAIRAVLKNRRAIISPNAEWMEERLTELFGDLAKIKPVPFGIDQSWYDIERRKSDEVKRWIVVLRVTEKKIGPLFDWGEKHFANTKDSELHLFGPNQGGVQIPDWVHYHGSATPEQLSSEWFPKVDGMITLSQHDEGRPQVLLEAMASGLPIIGSGISAHKDLIKDRETGLIVESEAHFDNALKLLSNKAASDKISRAAREEAQNRFGTWNDCSNRFKELYLELLS